MSDCRLTSIAVIAKEPLAGKAKTRLISPGVSAVAAASLAECALQDTLDALAAVDALHRVLIFDGSPPSWTPGSWRIQAQSCGLLDERLASGFDRLAAGPALLVGMDTPQLRPADLGFDYMTYDGCLGLASDGGYWAIGFADPRAARAVISGVPMSEPATGAIQLDRMRSAGMQVQLLPVLTDVDTAASADQVAALSPYTRFAARWRELRVERSIGAGRLR